MTAVMEEQLRIGVEQGYGGTFRRLPRRKTEFRNDRNALTTVSTVVGFSGGQVVTAYRSCKGVRWLVTCQEFNPRPSAPGFAGVFDPADSAMWQECQAGDPVRAVRRS